MSRIALIQMCAGADPAANCATAGRLVAEAAAAGAGLVALPESWFCIDADPAAGLRLAEDEGRGPLQAFLAGLAARHGVWLLGGTLPLRGEEPDRVCAAALLFDARGRIGARYDKVHLFDVDVADAQGRYRESRVVEPGERIVVADTPFGRLGLTVCYDLRFPELFRAMSAAGAEVFVVPSAFTAVTGRAHWETLLRARAIENLAWVLAPAQCGTHPGGRETHGDSLVVEPWGEVIARRASGEGIVLAEIDLERGRRLRAEFPCLDHRRL
ncbi:MAG TPA: carbon-nitrogen hydrolase family protein [Plasticicumulans sp.]|uniref:carbon-nitrogen hydrolase family protein n=1 Tax=Plasticicumulans sp. TaxID=2307179 RepID=UPI002C558946|nr:carbon-nitrogen hydrolase family protein [Plasticicumulans sp.]MBS0601916.1 carbon-nitrogen hydrolase family protein [Pseudomonadota bacterium]HMW31197.1 carbon-nitrogen hydrolase family protein [Plasticicumulans sp.]HMW42366.1 carbon-nitrogen hydrolase family protein [Plasticicumulans sp.]HNF67310.1 carbon-nitrogen hydrolase family protein [Plasticicumulans sp.]HNG50468.1 carbon-nitrogen hydrolase family protein [Plasticicumulans sp.]